MFSGLSFIHISEAQRGEGCPVFLKAVFPVFDRLAKWLQRLPFCGEDPRSRWEATMFSEVSLSRSVNSYQFLTAVL